MDKALRILQIFDEAILFMGRLTQRSYLFFFNFISFCVESIKQIPLVSRNPAFTIEQMYIIGITSLPLVAITSVFTGGVVAVQSITQFGDFLPLRYVGTVVGKSVMVELGPVLTALVVAGRVGAAMAAEIGTMAVTEQLDAMRCLGLSPHRFLVAPRLVAGMLMLPVLTIYSSLVSIMGALSVVYFMADLSPSIFWSGVRLFYSDLDLMIGLLKAFVFGFILTSFGCYFGYTSTHGAEGVGKATQASVVASAITILIFGFIISHVFLNS